MTTKRFSDFAAEQGPLEGDKVSINSILNTEVLMTGYRIQDSKYQKNGSSRRCLTVQFERDGDAHVFFTGSEVLAAQFEKYGHELPFLAAIKKIDRYYTLS
jgi:hypothetical protein